ncbi:MAG: T9SS type A sorting domain-containing protein [Prolixibacteraceae bacterium]|nr:T9SS type A sorting domain-containing protein [Prolixibacteraceae bacterium]
MKDSEQKNRIYFSDNKLHFIDTPIHSQVTIYNISGVSLKTFKLESSQVPVQLPFGVYVVTTESKGESYAQKIIVAK